MINAQDVARRMIQTMVNDGDVTFMGTRLVYHGVSGAYTVGTEDDLSAALNRIRAYQNKERNKP